jgi:uncharacterized protein YggU (UPF0235/DUF167 family)
MRHSTEPRYLQVRARAGAKKETVEQVSTTKWIVSVREKPEQGAANERIRELLAACLRVPVSSVRLVKGGTSPSKLFTIINHEIV